MSAPAVLDERYPTNYTPTQIQESEARKARIDAKVQQARAAFMQDPNMLLDMVKASREYHARSQRMKQRHQQAREDSRKMGEPQ